MRVPGWVCEILSPTTERKDRTEKLPLHALANVGHVWLVDPDARFVEVYASRGGTPTQVLVAREEEVVVLPPFDVSIELARVWGRA